MQASDSGTVATLSRDNSVNNNMGVGLNAQNGGLIECQGPNTVTGNTGGNILANVSGCP